MYKIFFCRNTKRYMGNNLFHNITFPDIYISTNTISNVFSVSSHNANINNYRKN